jgi:hypothetical protein
MDSALEPLSSWTTVPVYKNLIPDKDARSILCEAWDVEAVTKTMLGQLRVGNIIYLQIILHSIFFDPNQMLKVTAVCAAIPRVREKHSSDTSNDI